MCRQCGGDFLGKKGASFCNRICFGAWQLGNVNRGPKSDEHRRKLAEAQRGKRRGPQTADHRRKLSEAKKGKRFSEEHRAALSLAKVRQMQSGVFGGRQTAYISCKSGTVEHAHSSYELRRMRFLDASPDVKSWTKRHGISIPYEFDGQVKQYIPDFLVEWSSGLKTLEEVKGWVREPARVAAKEAVGVMFAQANGFRYVTLRNGDLESTCGS